MSMLAQLGLTLAGAAAYPVIDRLLSGSPEDQLRRQMQVQDEFEQARGQRMGAGGGLEGLYGGSASPESMAQLLGEDRLMREVENSAYKLNRARNARPRYLDELEDIISGQDARIAALQANRMLAPMEVIQMLEQLGG